MLDFLRAFQKGRLTEADVIKEMITHLGGSLYSYMVMLEQAEREQEAKRMEDLRTRIFNIRSRVAESEFATDAVKALDPVAEMQRVAIELETVGDMIRIYRPKESTVFQSPVSNAIGLVWVLKEYMEKNAA